MARDDIVVYLRAGEVTQLKLSSWIANLYNSTLCLRKLEAKNRKTKKKRFKRL